MFSNIQCHKNVFEIKYLYNVYDVMLLNKPTDHFT